MTVLIDIGHPAHVHLFKNFANIFQQKGHTVLFTVRSSECEIELLKAYDFKFFVLGKKNKSLAGKIVGIIKFDFKLLRVALKYKPDIFFSHGSIYAAHVAAMLGKPHISMEDSGNMEQIRLYRPFTKAILTPDILNEKLGEKQIRYKGYHELCYLHPNYFQPNEEFRKWLGLSDGEKYCIVRFVSWKATHDIGQGGFSYEEKVQLIKKLSDTYRVFITAEGVLQEEFKQFKLSIPPQLLHHVLAYAEMVISEGATIASESGLLGSASVYYSSIARSYLEDQEKYGTVHNFRPGNGIMQKIDNIIRADKKVYKEKSEKLIADKIDVNAFTVWFIENYPQSLRTMKENPDYQLKFK
jgi:uncharacterized protein